MKNPHTARAAVLAVALAAASAAAAGAQQGPGAEAPAHDSVTVAAVDQRLRVLERLLALEREAAASAATLSAGPEGVQIRSADGAFALRLRGYLHSDGRFFAGGAAPQASTFQMRRIRPILEGTVARSFHFRLMTDFGDGRAAVQDAYVDAAVDPRLRVRVGKFKAPVGLERLQSATALSFVERGLPTALVPNRDVGVQLHGELAAGVLAYQAGVFNGVVDGGSADVDADGHREFAGRLVVQPFRGGAEHPLRGLGIAIAGSTGAQGGTPAAPGLPTYRTVGQQPFFSFRADGQAAGTAVADGRRRRLAPQGWLYLGPLALQAEQVASTQRVRLGDAVADLTQRAWQGSASWVLTGEDAAPGGVRPGAAGALELAARVGALRVDDAAFPRFADPARAPRAARHWGVGLTWTLNRNVRVLLDYDRTTFAAAADGPARDAEEGILTRLQLAF